jgi:acetyl esterase/lipase
MLPAGAVCISPWTDLALTGASIQNNQHCDPVLSPDALERYAQDYANGHSRTLTGISPHYANLQDLPPLLIQVGTQEILLDDAARFANKAQKANVNVTLEIWDGMFHNFQLLQFLPETKKAMKHIAEFVSQRLK